MTEYLSKINLLSQEQYDGSSQKEGELYLVPDIEGAILNVSPSQNVYTLNLTKARKFKITTDDTVYKKIVCSYLPKNEPSFKFTVIIDYKQEQSLFFSKTIWKEGKFPAFSIGNMYVIEIESFDGGETFFGRVLDTYDMYIAKDNFDRANGALSGKLVSGQIWESSSAVGTWEIVDNKLKAIGENTSKLIVTDVENYQGISISSDIYIGGSIDAGLVAWYLNSSNYLQISIDGAGQCRVQQLVNGVVENANATLFSSPLIVLGTTINLKAEILNDEIKVYVNNSLIGQKPHYKKTTHTRTGFKHYAGSTVTFDNFSVKKI